ncbi:MAG: PKD domain-containing protein [Bacteroidetes bacterium]|nr:PKD domain-containing protein [Bacteroidota bacterium]
MKKIRILLLLISSSTFIINHLFSQNAKLIVFNTGITVKDGTSLFTSGANLNQGSRINNYGNLLITGDFSNNATPKEIVCVGEAGTVLISKDGGKTWKVDTPLTYQGNLSKVSLSVKDTSVSGEGIIYASGQAGAVLKSADGGNTWTSLPQQTTNDLRAISVIDDQTAIAVGDAGKILKTTDGGLSWVTVQSAVPSDLRDVTFIDDTTGFIVCSGGSILKTVDGGATWTTQATVAGKNLNAVKFSRDALAGYAVGDSGTILRSIDRGETWELLTATTPYELKSVEALNARDAAAVGANGTLLKTTDGGLSWYLQQVSSQALNDISAINDKQAIIVGDNGEIYKMCNILNACTQLGSPTNRRIESIGTRATLTIKGTVKFIGSTKQTISGNTITIFKDLVINNKSNGIIMQAPVVVNNSLLLSKGIVYTTAKTPLALLDNAATTGGDDSAFIEGPVMKFGDDSFLFPLGRGSFYHPLSISAPSSREDVFSAEYFDTAQNFGNTLDTTLEAISDCEYWMLSRLSGRSAVFAGIGWNLNSCLVNDLEKVTTSFWDSAQWRNGGSSSTSGSLQKGFTNGSTLLFDPGNFGPAPIPVIPITIGKIPVKCSCPKANFTYSPPCEDEPVTFQLDQSCSNIPSAGATYFWNLGNTTSTSPSATTTYQNPGTYNVSLTISQFGCPPSTVRNTITIHEPPVVTANPAMLEVCPGSSTPIDLTASVPPVDNFAIQCTKQPTAGTYFVSTPPVDLTCCSDITIEAWVWLDEYVYYSSQSERVIICQNNNLDWKIAIKNNDMQIYFILNAGGALETLTVNFSSPLPKGKWFHVAGTYNGSSTAPEQKLYLDGVTFPSWSYDRFKDGRIGFTGKQNFLGTSDGTNGILYGILDEVRIWKVAKSQTDISGGMSCTVSPNASGLVAAWPMNEGSPSITTADITGHNYTGNLINISQWQPSAVAPVCNEFVWDPPNNITPNLTTSTNIQQNATLFPPPQTTTSYTVTVTDNNGCTDDATVTIKVPYVTLNPTDVSSCIACNGSIVATVRDGTPPYTYYWPDGSFTSSTLNNQTISGLCAGTYTVTVIDGNLPACTVTATATISSTALAVTSQVTNPMCPGPPCDGQISVQITSGTSPYEYEWSNGSSGSGTTSASSFTITGLCAGPYNITVHDAHDCTVNVSSLIEEPTITITLAAIDVSCYGESSGSVIAAISGDIGPPPYSFSWSDGSSASGTATSHIVSNLSADEYFLTVTYNNNLCTAETSVTVSQPAESLSVSVSTTGVACNNVCTGSASVTVTGGTPPYAYDWGSGASTNTTTASLCAGTHTVTVSDINQCSIIYSFTISQLTSALTVSSTTTSPDCFGQCTGTASLTVTGGTPPYTYDWGSGPSNITTTASLCAGTHTVTVSDINQCSIVYSFAISQPSAVTFSSTTTSPDCFGQCTGALSVIASGGTAPYNYAWGSCSTCSSTTTTRTNLCAGSYPLTVTDSKGCVGTESIIITQPAQLTVTIPPSVICCQGQHTGSLTANPTGGTPIYYYLWNTTPVQNTQTINNLSAGTYTVIVWDSKGCQASATATLDEPDERPNVTAIAAGESCDGGCDGTITLDFTNESQPGGSCQITYQWSGPNGTSGTGNGYNVTGLCTGSYTITVSVAGQCSTTVTATVVAGTALTAAISVDDNEQCLVGNVFYFTGTTNGTQNLTYNWDFGDGSTATTISNPYSYSYLLYGIFDVTLTVNSSGTCTATAQTSVTVNPTPVIDEIEVSHDCSAGSPGTGSLGISVCYSDPCSDNIAGNPCFAFNLSGTPSGGAPVNIQVEPNPSCYYWDFYDLKGGTYTITVTDAKGCTASQTVTIESSSTPLTGTVTGIIDSDCEGKDNGSFTVNPSGGTLPYAYAVTGPQNINVTQNAPLDLTNLPAGTYYIWVTDAIGCFIPLTATINNLITIGTSFFNVTPIFCLGQSTGSITVLATGGNPDYSYTITNPPVGWSGLNPNNTGSFIDLPQGTYSITIEDANGCIKEVEATIGVLEGTGVNAGPDVEMCLGDQVQLHPDGPVGNAAPSGISFVWTPEDGITCPGTIPCCNCADPIVSPGTTGTHTYTVTRTDLYGCVTDDEVTVTVNSDFTIDIPDVTTCPALPVTLNLPEIYPPAGSQYTYTYTWAPSTGLSCTNCPSPVATVPVQTTYNVTVTYDHCSATDQVTVFISDFTTLTFNVTTVGGNPLELEFTADPAGMEPYTWNFGDPASGTANSATGQTVTHTFSQPNTAFTVCLTAGVQSSCGPLTVCKDIYISQDCISGIVTLLVTR